MFNPFQYQRPLRPEAVINREPEVARLIDGCYSGTMFRIDAPRRYGKTSLVRKTYSVATKDGTVGVLVDLKGVLTLSDIIIRIGRAYAELRGPFRGWLDKTLQSIEVDFNISILGSGVGMRLTPRAANEEGALLALLDLPNKLTRQGVKQLIICFDEFQDVLQVEASDDKLRSVIQHHAELVAYLFAGSEPRLMRQLFETKHRAFWDQAEPLRLSPLAPAEVIDYIERQFCESGKDAGETAGRVASAADGHPQRVMFLANKLWSHTPPGEKADFGTWEAALADAMLQEEPAFEAEWRSFEPAAEQRVLRAIALYEGRPYRKAAAEAVGVPRGSVNKAVEKLVDSYVVRETDEGQFTFVDPLFGLYVRNLAEARLPELSDVGDVADSPLAE